MTEDAIVARGDGGLVLRFERRYPVAVEELWAHLTEPEHLAVWLPEATINPGPGGHLDFDWGEQGTGHSPFLTWSPPSVLEMAWVETHGVASVVRFELRPGTSPDGGTVLTLVHRNITEDAAGNGAGWHYYLDALAAHVEGRPSPGDARFEQLLTQYSTALSG